MKKVGGVVGLVLVRVIVIYCIYLDPIHYTVNAGLEGEEKNTESK